MKGLWLMVPEQPLSSDMAQMTSGLYSIFVFFICLLFLPGSWEAGANTFQELQETSAPSKFGLALPLTPDLTHRAPSDHKNSEQHPPDLPESTATQKSPKRCHTVRLVKPVQKPIDGAKATDYGNATIYHETPPASEKNLSSQGKHPMARNERSADNPGTTNSEKSSDGRHSTSAPRRSTTCKPSRRTRITRNSVTPVNSTMTSTRSTSQKPIRPSHDDSEHTRKTTSSPVKPTKVPRTSYRTPKTPTPPGTEHHTTLFASDKSVQTTTEHIRETTSDREKTTRSQSTSTEYGGETRPTSESISKTQVLPVEHHTPTASVNVTSVSAKSTRHPEEATSTIEKTTKAPESPTRFQRKTETMHQGITGSSTSRKNLRPMTSEAHHPQQSTHSLPGGLHDAGESDSFPVWAIVIVILMSVIILLIFLGLIFLVFWASRARHILTQNSEDAEPEDKEGRNSYSVYLMEQQNLKPNQIPSPP